MFEFADILFDKRRLIVAIAVPLFIILLICIIAPIVYASGTSTTADAQPSHAAPAPQAMYDSPNVVSNGLAQASSSIGYEMDNAGANLLSGIVSVAAAITHFDTATVNGTQAATTATVHGIGTGLAYSGRGILGGLGFIGHAIGSSFSALYGLSHLSSVIQPGKQTNVPVIVLRQRQAALIQSGTTDVIVAASNGAGGACDNGNGNGAYPAVWCNAPMDSLATVYGNGDLINRECTSYAYWYFTSVEGHADFKASADAKYWASTTNYPVHYTPAVGAIAVETGGAYGHVAIVQALPGQTYAGQVVPAGEVLVSEMNYDWQGHFRYSYSPISKFSAYIY